MTVESVVALLLAAAVVALVLGGLAAARRRMLRRPAGLEANPSRPRLSAEVHAGEEQVLIHLARALALPSGREQVAYGGIYLAGSEGSVLTLASRSEIGRGFSGEVRVRRARRSSHVDYVLLRVPDDEALVASIAGLDDRIVASLRALDPGAVIRRAAEPAGRPSGRRATAQDW